MEPTHHEKVTGHTVAISEEIPVLIADASKIRSSKLQDNGPFHRIVLKGICSPQNKKCTTKITSLPYLYMA